MLKFLRCKIAKGRSLLLTVFLVLAAIGVLAAEPPEVEWAKTFGESGYEQGYFAQQTTDGGYIVVGTSLIKADSLGQMLWEKPFSGEFVQQTSDGGYVVVGGRNGMVLTKLDAAGTKKWERVFQEDGEGWGHCVRQTIDGGYIVAGEGGDPGTASFLVKTDGNGNEEWRQVCGYSYTSRSYESVQQTYDGNYVVGGTLCHPYPCDVFIEKCDSGGDIVQGWGGFFRDDGSSAGGECLQQTTDTGFIIVGTTKRGTSDIHLVKLDIDGNIQWESYIGREGADDAGYYVLQTADGSSITAGYTRAAGNADVHLVKADSQGNVLWEKTIDKDFSEAACSIQPTTDGGYIIAGYTSSWTNGNWNYDIYLIKLKSEDAEESNGGFEHIREDSEAVPSGVKSAGEFLEQVITVTDDDANIYNVRMIAVEVQNAGTAAGGELAKVELRTDSTVLGVAAGPELVDFKTGMTINLITPLMVSDDATATLKIYYFVGDPVSGHTLRPRVKVLGREPHTGTTADNYWSDEMLYPDIIRLVESHAVSTPNTPSGSSTGQEGESLNFSTGGSTCNQGHSVQYQFDWGDGSPYSTWSSSASASHTYSATGTYQVRAQARCASVTSITSGWSATKTVNIGETPLPENQQPDPPANLAQLDPGGSEIPVGDAVDTDSVVFRATITDPDGDEARLQVELRRLDEFGGNFDETQGGFKESDLVSTGTIITCTAYGLIDDSYHWRARAVDEHGGASDWVQFGNNNILEADFTIASASVRLPVLLVHGFQLSWGYDPGELWSDMSDVLSDSGLTLYVSDYGKRGATWDDIRSYAAVLAGEIEAIKVLENVDQVDVVAHSMGGLVARAYIESADFSSYIGQPGFPDYGFSYEGDVRKLIMLGTPNHGALPAWLATLVTGGAKSTQQMHPGSDFLNILNHGCRDCSGEDEIVAGVEYVVFAGEECDECPEFSISPPTPGLSLMQATSIETLFSCLGECRARGEAWKGDDGVVSMERARLDNASLHACIPADHTALRTQEQICEAVRAKLLSQPVPNVIWISDVIQIACPVHVTVTDQYGRIINDSGTDEIPGASVTKDEESDLITIYLNPNLVYDVYIEAYENGKFTLVELLQTQNEGFMVNLFENIPVVAGTKAEFKVIPTETERLLEIDSDGNGTIDEEREPIVIGEEEDALPDEGSAVVVGPNPVSSQGCVFWLDLPEDLSQCKLLLFGISGRLLFETTVDPEDTRFPSGGTWNPVDNDGVPLANGPYVYVLIGDGKVIGKGKMVIQR